MPCGVGAVCWTSVVISARSYHLDGVNTARADGSIHFVVDQIDQDVWQALGSINGQDLAD